MYFSLPQLFVLLFDVLSFAVFVIRDRFCNVRKKKERTKEKKKQQQKARLLLKSLSLCNKVLSYVGERMCVCVCVCLCVHA